MRAASAYLRRRDDGVELSHTVRAKVCHGKRGARDVVGGQRAVLSALRQRLDVSTDGQQTFVLHVADDRSDDAYTQTSTQHTGTTTTLRFEYFDGLVGSPLQCTERLQDNNDVSR